MMAIREGATPTRRCPTRRSGPVRGRGRRCTTASATAPSIRASWVARCCWATAWHRWPSSRHAGWRGRLLGGCSRGRLGRRLRGSGRPPIASLSRGPRGRHPDAMPARARGPVIGGGDRCPTPLTVRSCPPRSWPRRRGRRPSRRGTGATPSPSSWASCPPRGRGPWSRTSSRSTDHLSEVLGIPVEGFVSTDYAALVTAMETGQAQIARAAALRAGPGVDRAGAEIPPSVGPLRQYDLSHPVHDDHARQVLRRRARGREHAVEGEEMVSLLNCNGTARAFDESPEGPIGAGGARGRRAGHAVARRRALAASGYIFPVTIFAHERHRPRDGRRARPSPGP